MPTPEPNALHAKPMNKQETLDALANLPDDAKLTFTVHAGEFRRAMERAAPGPEAVSTTWCQDNLGYSSRQWRQWCEEGKIPGSGKDAGGRWRLPNRVARTHFDAVLRAGGASPVPPGGPGAGEGTDVRVTPIRGRKRRGPWKKKTHAGGQP